MKNSNYRKKKFKLILTVAFFVILIAVAGYFFWEHTRTKISWEPVFKDNFNRNSVGNKYSINAGVWKIKSKKLLGKAIGQSIVSINKKFPGNFKIKFTVKVLTESAKNEIALFIDKPDELFSGYYLGFGGDYKTVNLDLSGNEIFVSAAPPVESEKQYSIVVIRKNNILEMKVNGRKILNYNDPFPLDPSIFSRIRLGTYDGSIEIDRIKVYQENIPEVIYITAIGDHLFQKSQFKTAQRAYRKVLSNHKDEKYAGEALFKIGMCFLHMVKFDKAIETFHKVKSVPVSEFYKNLSLINIGTAYRLKGQFTRAFEWFRKLEKKFDDINIRYRIASELKYLASEFWLYGERKKVIKINQFIAEKFPNLHEGKSSAFYLIDFLNKPELRKKKLSIFIKEDNLLGKINMLALTKLAGTCLLLNDIECAISSFKTIEERYREINKRFSLQGIFGQALVLASEGKFKEARNIAEKMHDYFPWKNLPARKDIELEYFIAQQKKDFKKAISILKTLMIKDNQGRMSLHFFLEFSNLYKKAGYEKIIKTFWQKHKKSEDELIAKTSKLMLGETGVSVFEKDRSISTDLRNKTMWYYYLINGETKKAAETNFYRKMLPFTPSECQAILIIRKLRQSGDS